MARIVVGTADGLVRFDAGTGDRQDVLGGHRISAVAPAGWKQLWAIVDDREVWRSDGLEDHWKQVASLESGEGKCIADTRANAENGMLIGTSEAHLVRVAAGRAELVESFEEVAGRDDWFTPWGGPPDVRSITEDHDAVYVNVHVGGVLRSRDGGSSWVPTIDIHADVHRVVTGHGRIYAAGASGLSVSPDGGDTWELRARGLHADYCRAVAISGASALLSASDGPGGGRAALYRTSRDAESFERCRQGLPEWFDGNIDSLCLDALPDGTLSAFASEAGEVFLSKDQGASWTRLAEGLPGVRCLLVLP